MKAHRCVNFKFSVLELKHPADCRIFIPKTTFLYTSLPGKLNSSQAKVLPPLPPVIPSSKIFKEKLGEKDCLYLLFTA